MTVTKKSSHKKAQKHIKRLICGRLLDMSTAKNEVQQLLKTLPDDCSLEDIQYHLYVIEKVRNGLEMADSQGTLSQEEVEQRLGKWLTE